MENELEYQQDQKEFNELLNQLENGEVLTKYGRRGKPHPRRVCLTRATSHPHQNEYDTISWGKGRQRTNSIQLVDISRIQRGRNTSVFDRFRSKKNDETNSRSFSVISHNRSLDFECATRQQRDQWVESLQRLVDKQRGDSDPEKLLLRQEWNRADTDGDGTLTQKEVRDFMKKQNLNMTKKQIEQLFRKADMDHNGVLDFNEFYQMREQLLHRREFEAIFKKYAAKNPSADVKINLFGAEATMSMKSFMNFLHIEQKSKKTMGKTERMLTDVLPEREKGSPLTQRQFIKFLSSRHNQAIHIDHLHVYQDMDFPLTDYYVSSSHNTYLEGDQLRGNSSVDMYIRILRLGCRCVELDCWDGNDGEPIIYHGHTLTSRISFKDVIKAIREHAFKASVYPVILSLENHCSIPQQQKMAQYMTEIFGDSLYIHSADGSKPETLPSPRQLKYKILLKGKSSSESKEESDYGDSGSDSAFDGEKKQSEDDLPSLEPIDLPILESHLSEKAAHGRSSNREKRRPSVKYTDFLEQIQDLDPEKLTGQDLEKALEDIEKKRKKQEPKKIAAELSAIIYLKGTKHHDFEDDTINNAVSYQISSFAEGKFQKYCRQCPERFCRMNHRCLSRTYPAGKRVKSSNYDPVPAWNMGCQLVALNYQTVDRYTCINMGKFQPNGQSGYILKPRFLRDYRRPFDCNNGPFKNRPLKLRITVISGLRLPKPQQQSKGEIVDPYVKVQLHGLAEDETWQTRPIPDNGFNPVWNQKVKYTITEPEISIISFVVYDHDFGKDDFLAHGAVPVHECRAGYRFIPLHNHNHEIIPQCGLFVHFKFSKYSCKETNCGCEEYMPSKDSMDGSSNCSTCNHTPDEHEFFNQRKSIILRK